MHSKREKHLNLVANTSVFCQMKFIEQAQNEPVFSLSIKEYITNSLNNCKNKTLAGTLKSFKTSQHIFMLCGRNCYEVLCSNLSMPEAPTVCESIYSKNLYQNILKCHFIYYSYYVFSELYTREESEIDRRRATL